MCYSLCLNMLITIFGTISSVFQQHKKIFWHLKIFRVFIHILRYLQCNKNLFFFLKPIYKIHYILEVEHAPSWPGSHSIFFSEFDEQPIPQKPDLNSAVNSLIIEIMTFASKILQWWSLLLNLRLDKHEDSKAFKI